MISLLRFHIRLYLVITLTAILCTQVPAAEQEPTGGESGSKEKERKVLEALFTAGFMYWSDGPPAKTISFRSNQKKFGKDTIAQLMNLTKLKKLEFGVHNITNAELKYLTPFARLEFLNIGYNEIDDSGLAYLAPLTQLRTLSLNSTNIKGSGLKYLVSLKQLQSLDLGHTKITGSTLAHLKHLPELRTLYLDRTSIDSAGMKALGQCRKLERLHLSFSKVSKDGLKDLARLPNLRVLKLGGDQMKEGLSALTQLEELHVDCLGAEEFTDSQLVHLRTLHGLKKLGIYQAELNGDGLKYLKECMQLQELNLDETTITEQSFASLPVLPKVHTVNLRMSRIDDSALRHLKNLTHLETLVLRATEITDAGLIHLGKLKNLKNLNLNYTKVTDAGLVYLKGLTRLEKLQTPIGTLRGKNIPLIIQRICSPVLKDFTNVELRSELKGAGAFLKTETDSRTGFIVGGQNTTWRIRNLTEINGKSIASLETAMRPGAYSGAGFLGKEEGLLEVMAADNRYVVDKLGLTHQELAHHLLAMDAIMTWRYENDHGFFGRRPISEPFLYHGRRFQVEIAFYGGSQKSPFDDGAGTSSELTVHNLDNGKKLWYSMLVPMMIERYGFYEGKGTRYRVEPKKILEVFDFIEVNPQRNWILQWPYLLVVSGVALALLLLLVLFLKRRAKRSQFREKMT